MSLSALAITYLGLGVAGVLASRRPAAIVATAARGAWAAAAGTVLAACLSAGPGQAAVSSGVGWAVAPAAWSFAASLAHGERGRWTLGALGALLCGLGGMARGGLVEAVGAALSVGLGLALATAMQGRRWPRFRLVVYTLSFFATFALFLPLLVSPGAALSASIPAPRLALVLGLAAAALALGLAGAAGLHAAGGTPEPLDPPPSLCVTGIYARIRHPLQLAEVLAVFSGALAIGSSPALVYALCFAVGLLGPMRLLEERTLLARHGAAFTRYRAVVPAWVPRWPRAG